MSKRNKRLEIKNTEVFITSVRSVELDSDGEFSLVAVPKGINADIINGGFMALNATRDVNITIDLVSENGEKAVFAVSKKESDRNEFERIFLEILEKSKKVEEAEKITKTKLYKFCKKIMEVLKQLK